MMMLVDALEQQPLHRNKPQLILTTVNDKNFVTPKFMRHAERLTAKKIHLIDKMALVGLSSIQAMILKGYNILIKRNFQTFDNKPSDCVSIDMLINGPTTSNSLDAVFGVVAFVGAVGAGISAGYFGANAWILGKTGKDIGHYIDEKCWIFSMPCAPFIPIPKA